MTFGRNVTEEAGAYYCPCGCAQEVAEEGAFSSDECEEYPEVPFPFPQRTATQTWQQYLDGFASDR